MRCFLLNRQLSLLDHLQTILCTHAQNSSSTAFLPKLELPLLQHHTSQHAPADATAQF
jgi:hypothetical protein